MAEVVTLDPRPAPMAAALLKGLYMRPSPYGWRSLWKWSRPAEALTERRFLTLVRRSQPDAVLQIGDYGDPGVPFFLYQDLSFGTVERRYEELARYMWLPLDVVKRRRAHQEHLYRRVETVFTMSEWLAADLRQNSCLDPARIRAVGGGMNADVPPDDYRPSSLRHADPGSSSGPDRSRLLFIGRDFFRKGGDLVVDAFCRLRRSADRELSLTLAGPQRWPLPGSIPEGVDFRGEVSLSEAGALYQESDLFVMPSRFEPFGLVFVEALSHGVPCIGRNDFAMPELIRPGENGALVSEDDADRLASTMWSVLQDDGIYQRCDRDSEAIRRKFSWESVAGMMMSDITAVVQP